MSSKVIELHSISQYLGKIGNHSLTLRNPKDTPEVSIWNPPKDGFCLLHCVVILYHILREKDVFLFDEAFNGNGSLFEKMPLNLCDIKRMVDISAIKASSEFSEECKSELSRISEESIGDLDNVILQVFNSIPFLITGNITWLENRLRCFQGHFYLVLTERDDIEIFNRFISGELNILQQMNEKSDELKKVLEENLKQFSTVFDTPSIEEYQEILNAYSICDILTQEKKQRSLSEDETVQLASLNSFLEDKVSREDIEEILKTLS
jgi:hypothetical protein